MFPRRQNDPVSLLSKRSFMYLPRIRLLIKRVIWFTVNGPYIKECFEDVMAFKSRLMRELAKRTGGEESTGELVFRVLAVDSSGSATEETIGVTL